MMEGNEMASNASPSAHVATQSSATETASGAPSGVFGLGPAWRRGLMHAVERIDLARATKGSKADKLAAIERALDEVTRLAQTGFPKSYEEAFALCTSDLRAALARAENPS